MRVFTDEEIQSFIDNGFVAVRGAFTSELASACRDEIWNLIEQEHPDIKRNTPKSWTKNLIRIQGSDADPIVQSANTPRLHQAFNEVVGIGRWDARNGIGTFPIRFPSDEEPEAGGFHIDGSIGVLETDSTGYNYKVNLVSDYRALLVLFLYSDVTIEDGATRLLVGSHLDVAPILKDADPKYGMFWEEIAPHIDIDKYEIAYAEGNAGDVYLVHPFTVHAGAANRGTSARIIAQPELPPVGHFELDRPDGDYSPVEAAVRMGLGL